MNFSFEKDCLEEADVTGSVAAIMRIFLIAEYFLLQAQREDFLCQLFNGCYIDILVIEHPNN